MTESTVEAHVQRIKGRLDEGRHILETIHASNKTETYDIPDVFADENQLLYDPPREGDPFFLATDERSPDGIKSIKENGAVSIGDLITAEDRREFGLGIMLTDILALVEQAVLARSYFFCGQHYSSMAGGVVNYRAARGVDPRTTTFD